MADLDPTDSGRELGYLAKRGGIYIAAKEVVVSAGNTVGNNLGSMITPEIANLTGMAATGLSSNIALASTIGLTAGVSAALTQMDYLHKKERIREFYQEEISTKLGKKKVTVQDMEKFAEQNPTMQEAVNKEKRNRNYGVFLSFFASLVSLAVVKVALPAVFDYVAGAEGAFEALSTVAHFAIAGATGLATYYAAKTPLHWLGDKLFGLDDKTTHDKIVELEHEREAGKTISRMQVLSVFVEANHQLDRFIVAEYGQRFDKLPLSLREQVTKDLSKLIPLEQLANDINSGRVNAAELAFAVEGEISGVNHPLGQAPKKEGMLVKAVSKLKELFRKKAKDGEVQAKEETPPLPSFTVPVNTVYQQEEPPVRSFVERLGRGPVDQNMGHVERLEQQQPGSLATER